MHNLWQDIRYGIRGLLRQPGFTAIAVGTLALAIGVNTALFSIVNAVLINPLPFAHPDQLVALDQSKPNFENGALTYPNFQDLQKGNQTFAAMTLYRSTGFSLIGAGDAERVNGRYVSADFFNVFEVQPTLGRGFASGEDEPGVAPVAIISTALWQRKFGGTQDVLGKVLTLDDKAFPIVGVLPPDFPIFRTTDVYVPIGQWNAPGLKRRGTGLGLHGFGRLKPAISIDQGRSDLNRIMQNLAATYPDTNRGNGAAVSPLKERIVADIGPTLWLLLGAVGFVLLIACVNVSNLLLARSTARTREFAIRAALGAGWARLVRQSITEGVLLAVVGGALGLMVASWGTQLALTALPTTLPRAGEIHLDSRVLIFALLISLLSGVLSSLAPALKNSSWRLSETLKKGGRGTSGRGRAQSVLVAIEMALAVVLLIGGGLMVRSLRALWTIDPGFRADNVLGAGVSLSPAERTAAPESIRAHFRELSDQLNSAPGIRGASFSAGALPLQGEDDLFFWIDGQTKPASQTEMSMALIYRVEPTYLSVMGIPLKQGRFFTNQDDERSRPVVVIDEVFAQKHFAGVNPIGKRIRQGDDEPQTIIGIVGHVRQWGLDGNDTQTLQAQLYEPFRQLSDDSMTGVATSVGVVTLGDGSTPTQMDAMRRVIQGQNRANTVFSPQTMNEAIAASLATQRFSMIVLDAFAVVALLLASVGLYGVISYLVGLRTQELGIRLALGARRINVLGLVLGQGMKMTVIGIAIGVVAAFGLTRLLLNMLYGVSPTDPLTFIGITGLLLIVALLACFVPARRATKVDPLVALRYE